MSGGKIVFLHLRRKHTSLHPISTCGDVTHGYTPKYAACAVDGEKKKKAVAVIVWEHCGRKAQARWGLFSDSKQKL